jgi:hypothetical protein
MGRPYTGADTVYSSPRLELSQLRKAGYFRKRAEVSGTWSWTNGDAVRILTKWIGAEVVMELRLTWTHPHTGEAEEVHQRITVVSKPSNLGRGHVLYFICPQTGRACRILYRAYHARTFRSRWGFSYRLYYPSQTCGKLNRWDETYWNAERHLERSKGKRNPGTYRGKPTKRSKRRERLLEQLIRADEARWSPACWPIRLRGAFMDLR